MERFWNGVALLKSAPSEVRRPAERSGLETRAGKTACMPRSPCASRIVSFRVGEHMIGWGTEPGNGLRSKSALPALNKSRSSPFACFKIAASQRRLQVVHVKGPTTASGPAHAAQTILLNWMG
jgi:hypothetical protein